MLFSLENLISNGLIKRFMGIKPEIIDGRAVDPWSLIFPGSVYIKIIEWKHPHEPKVMEIQAALRGLTANDRKAALNRAKALIKVGKAVEEASAKSK
jgi:hypothetical protein